MRIRKSIQVHVCYFGYQFEKNPIWVYYKSLGSNHVFPDSVGWVLMFKNQRNNRLFDVSDIGSNILTELTKLPDLIQVFYI